jgi:hypothetical protein
MAEKRKVDEPAAAENDETKKSTGDEDTEGHFMLPDPGAARIVADSRARDIEREARFRIPFTKRGNRGTSRGR